MPKDWVLKKYEDAVECFYCERHFGLISERKTLDHIIPLSKGGKNIIRNTVVCCEWCNGQKGDKSLDEFYEHIETVKTGIPNSKAEFIDVGVIQFKIRHLQFLIGSYAHLLVKGEVHPKEFHVLPLPKKPKLKSVVKKVIAEAKCDTTDITNKSHYIMFPKQARYQRTCPCIGELTSTGKYVFYDVFEDRYIVLQKDGSFITYFPKDLHPYIKYNGMKPNGYDRDKIVAEMLAAETPNFHYED